MKSINDLCRSVSETLGYDIFVIIVLLIAITILDGILYYIGNINPLNEFLVVAGVFGGISLGGIFLLIFICSIIYHRFSHETNKVNIFHIFIVVSFFFEISSILLIVAQALIYAGLLPFLESVNTTNLTNASAKANFLQAKIGASLTSIVVLATILPLKILYLNVLMNMSSRGK